MVSEIQSFWFALFWSESNAAKLKSTCPLETDSVINYIWMQRKLKSLYLRWFPSNFWGRQYISQTKLKLMTVISLCFQNEEPKRKSNIFQEKFMFLFYFHLFVLRIKKNLEAVLFISPNVLTNSIKAFFFPSFFFFLFAKICLKQYLLKCLFSEWDKQLYFVFLDHRVYQTLPKGVELFPKHK